VWVLGDRRGQVQEVTITPELYARLRGPYNRRNPYGAVVAFGPLLHARPETRAMFMSVARHALCGEAPLLRELGVDADEVVGPRRLLQLPRRGTRTEVPLSLEISCR
jgi:hypothetical protein